MEEKIIPADPGLKTFTVDDIVKLYAVSRRSVLRYIQRGQLRATRVGRRFLITEENLKEFLAGRSN